MWGEKPEEVEFKDVTFADLEDLERRLRAGEKNIYIRIAGEIEDYRPVFTNLDEPREYARFKFVGSGRVICGVVWPDSMTAKIKIALLDGGDGVVEGQLGLDFQEKLEIRVSGICE
jgi:hypothetical protein